MGVSYSGYYAYACGTSYLKSEKDEALKRWVKKVFWDHKRRYGARRIAEELSGQGIKVGRYRVRRLMRQQGLRAIQPRSYVPRTTVSDNRRASPNLLTSISPNEPKAVLVGDITYLPLFGGKWCYLASWQDKVSKRVAGWSISDRMTEDLVIGALDKAFERGFITKDAIIHSDRGSQYASKAFRKLLSTRGLRQSMSGKGNCYDNAQAESFWARLKTELLEGGAFRSVEEARIEIFSYIDGYYNRIRRHSALGYLSPDEFEKRFEIAKNEKAGKSNRKEVSVRVVSSFT
jgi:transposase InsO family protein